MTEVSTPAAPAPAGRRAPRVSPRVAGVAVAAVAVVAAVVEYAHTGRLSDAGKALVAGALGAAIAWLVATLPGVTARGLLVGGFFVVAGMLSWTYLTHGFVVWAVLALEGVVFAVWTWPWLSGLRPLPRLGTAWLGLAYWLLGIVGAVLVAHATVAAQRIAYAGVFTLATMAVVVSTRRRAGRAGDLSVGVVAAFLLAIAALVLSGSGNLFDGRHPVPEGGWGHNQIHRFWGGHWLLYHPNSLALLAVVVAVRIGVDRAFATWQRLAVTALAGALLVWTNSRTGFIYFAAACVLHAWVLWRGRAADRPVYRSRLLAVAVPVVVLGLVLVLSGGMGYLVVSRYDTDNGTTTASFDPTSGRLETWKQVGREWRAAGYAEKLFGDAKTSRAVVRRETSGDVNLTTDNGAVGALRRGGVLGELAFLVGLGLLLWHAGMGVRRAGGRRAPPAWLQVASFGALPTIATADWFLGGTGGTLWILLVAGEAWLLFGSPGSDASTGASSDASTGAGPDAEANADART